MNNTTSVGNNSASSIDNYLMAVSLRNLITVVYTLPIASLISFILNIPCLIVLFHRKLKGDTFKYLVLKTLCHLGFLFIIALTPTFRCTSCAFSLTLFTKIVQYYLSICLLNPLSTGAALVEIALTYDRLLMLKQHKSKYLVKLRFWPTTICFIAISILVNLPIMFSVKIEQVPGTNIWLYLIMDFSNTAFYRFYSIFYSIMQALLALIVLVVLNILVKIEFSKYIKRKTNLTGNSKHSLRLVNNRGNST
jgi:hypothetical protein